jgi:4a-hydroxytetrahydrobiopterin dehydratase
MAAPTTEPGSSIMGRECHTGHARPRRGSLHHTGSAHGTPGRPPRLAAGVAARQRVSMTPVLDPKAVSVALDDLPGVHRGGAGRLQVRIKAPSFLGAISLVRDVAGAAEDMNHHPDIDLRYDTVTFTLATHSEGGVTDLDIDLARRILQLAAAAEASPVDPAGRVEIAIDAADAGAIRPFWQKGLGYVEQQTDDGDVELHDPAGSRPVVWFQTMSPPRTGRNRIHLDVVVPADDAEQRVADTLAAGGRLVTEEHAPDLWVIADAEGNELCVCSSP